MEGVGGEQHAINLARGEASDRETIVQHLDVFAPHCSGTFQLFAGGTPQYYTTNVMENGPRRSGVVWRPGCWRVAGWRRRKKRGFSI